ncbi:hypothetical protein BC829DRAFT_419055 [Chytridium lagenaria]|nr:hypothetical protein BC829DRAFT_419055 [Chytridium lagenaria]
MANASIECPILADALPTLNISRTQCCSTDFNDPVSCSNGRLVKVDFRNCAVNGPLSPLLANLTALRYFYLSNMVQNKSRLDNCRVTGSIPSWISAWERLYLLSLTENELAGPLPSSLERLRSLEQLYLQRNSLSGEVPSMQNSSELGSLNLSDNLLTGPIPPSLAALDWLLTLRLNGNRLYGPIPAEFGFERPFGFFELELHQNYLTGPVPILPTEPRTYTFAGNCIDEKDLMNANTSTRPGTSTMDDNDAADDKQENLFATTTFTPISNKAVEAGMILSAVEPAIQQSSTDLVMTNAASWSCEEVSTFLVNCGFDESVVDTFEDANVGWAENSYLTDMELAEMNFAEENTRVMVRFAIERLKFIQGRGDSSDAPGDLGADMPPEYS